MSRGNSRKRSSERTTSARHVWSIVAVAVVALLAVASVGLAFAAQNAPPATKAQERPRFTPTAVPKATVPARVQLADVMPRLRDTSRPFNVVVFSDSTGAGRETWTALTGEWIGEKYGRTVKGSQWDIHVDPNGYSPIGWNLTAGSGAPVTWWNGASSGKDAVYSLDNIDQLAPIPGDTVDLVFVNHGHNHANNELVNEGSALINEATTRYPNAAIVIIMENPERQASGHREVQRNEVQRWGDWGRRNGYPVIDVYTPFAEADVETLIDDTLYHPTPAGYQFWADIVTAELDAADPATTTTP